MDDCLKTFPKLQPYWTVWSYSKRFIRGCQVTDGL